jgi:hypothetical protein
MYAFIVLCVFVIVLSSRWLYLLTFSFSIFVTVNVCCSYVEEDYNFDSNFVIDGLFIGLVTAALFYWIRS